MKPPKRMHAAKMSGAEEVGVETKVEEFTGLVKK
jgi:hypothetical protein